MNTQLELLLGGADRVPGDGELLGLLGPAGDRIASLFECMETAEDEIAAARGRHPARDAEINAAFGLLLPQGELGRVERCYRAHCREILDAIGESREPPAVSWAECCLAFCLACCRAPFIAEAAVAYGLAFRRAFPDDQQAMGLQVPESTDALYMLPEAEALLTGLRQHIEQRKAAQA